MSKLVTRRMRVRRSKYTKRKGHRKYKKHYTRKNAKRIQNKKRLRRQTRRRVGGEKVIGVVPEQLEETSYLPEVKPEEQQEQQEVNPEQVTREPAPEPEQVTPEPEQVTPAPEPAPEPAPALADEVIPPNTESTGYEILKVLSNLYTLNPNNSNIDIANSKFTASLSHIFRYYSPPNNLGKLVKVFIDKIIGVKDSTIGRAQPIFILGSLVSLLAKITKDKNMEKLLHLLNTIMTDENMEKLLQLLKSMNPENMQKLLQLLKSMTPKTMSDLLYTLTHNIKQDNISKILDDYIKLDAESMAQLLELYSFIEKRDFLDNTNMYSVHRYLHGETPVSQRLLRNKKHKPTTCRSVKSLNATADLFKPPTSIINFNKDAEFQKVVKECELYPPQIVTGGGRRRRKTLKKKQRHVNKR
jgi:hypothetical protein